MKFTLVSLSGIQFQGDVYEVILPTLDGQIGVLDHHMALVSVATNGVVSVRHKAGDPETQLEYFAINGGVIDVADNELRVLVDEADSADDINEAEAEAAMERARQQKADASDEVSLEKAQQLIDRHSVRLQVAGLKRRKQR